MFLLIPKVRRVEDIEDIEDIDVICVNFRRDSFDQRICDDLSEVILQYLPIKDKFRFECVSKQFQRTLYVKHNQILIHPFVKNGFIQLIPIEKILRKCPNITSIRSHGQTLKIWPLVSSCFNSHLLVDLIQRYCHQLVEVSGDLFRNEEVFKSCVQTFSKKSFVLDSKHATNPILESLSHIKQLELKDQFGYYGTIGCFYQLFDINRIPLKNLKRVSFRFVNQDISSLKGFISNNKSLKYLQINAKEC